MSGDSPTSAQGRYTARGSRVFRPGWQWAICECLDTDQAKYVAELFNERLDALNALEAENARLREDIRLMAEVQASLQSSLTQAEDERDALRAKAALAEALLRELEWCGIWYAHGDSEACCEVCLGLQRKGHDPDCRLASALEAGGAP